MKRWAIVLGCVLSLVACTNDGSDEGGGSAGNAGTGAGAGAGATSGGGSGGSAGNAGTGAGTSGTGSVAGAAGTVAGAGAAGTTAGAGSSGTGGTGAGGTGGASGTGEAGEGGSSGGQSCGSRGLMECPTGSYCNFPESADCGRADAPGTCAMLTDIACGEIYAPVCGCDGETYSNACTAAQSGVSVDHDGECEAPEGGYDCVLDGVACLVALPECAEGTVPSADGACFGPCVPIEECKCGGPDDCPFPEKYTCWMSAGHCGPYTQ